MKNAGIHTITEKLEAFIKRYYLQKSYQGAIVFTAVFLGLFIIFSFVAFQFYLSTQIRTFLFFSFVGIMLILLITQLLVPLSKYFKIGKRLSNEQAAKIIGTHFKKEVGDQLLNAVLLYQQDNTNDLILASIEQKTNRLKGVNFLLAIPYEKLKLIAKYAIIPFIILLFCWVWKPQILSQGSKRIVAYQQEFIPQNPYQFEITNEKLAGVRNEPFTLKVNFKGNELPKDVFIEINNINYRLKRESETEFTYHINRLSDAISFRLKTGIYFSKNETIQPIDNAQLQNLLIEITEPKYLGGKNYQIKNNGNITVPEGAIVKWNVNSKHTNNTFFILNEDSTLIKNKHSIVAKNSAAYTISLTAKNTLENVDYNYDLMVIKDNYPTIELISTPDSTLPGVFYHDGSINDDHGFSKFELIYKVNDSLKSELLDFEPLRLSQNFSSKINFYELGLNPGDELEYYFSVHDNDGVNGPKSSSSERLFFTMPGKKSIDSLLNQKAEELKNLMASTASKSKALQQEFKEIKKLLVEKKNLSWQDQQKVQNFIQHQKSLEQDLLKIQKENKAKTEQKNTLSPQEKELMEKQEQLNKLFEELLDEETKKMFEELEKLMEELNNKNQEEQLEKINLKNENVEKSLDRTLELFKQMEFEQELDKTVKDLDELAIEQQKLEEETKTSKNEDSEELLKKQEKIEEEYKRLEEKIEDLKEKNNELEQQRNFENTTQEQQEINESLKNAKEDLKSQKQKAAAKQQKSGAKAMEKMADKLAQMQQKMDENQNAEDLNTTRQLLENLLYLSIEQEKLLEKSKQLSSFDAQYDVHIKNQQKLRDDAKVIEDSLFALSKRQVQLASFINKEMHEIAFNSDKAIQYLSNRQSQSAAVNQQFVMTSANNLALILDEAIQAMQNAMMKQQFGQGSCNKPGGTKPQPGSGMKSLQEMLSKQLEQMKKQLEEGNKPGKSGKKGKAGDAMSFGKMAAEQNAIKEKLKQLSQQLQNQGKGGLGDTQQLENDLEKTEKDLLNKNISPEMIKRQEEILTKLLEAEKAIQEREFEEKRESQQEKNSFTRNPSNFLEYKKTEISNDELLKITLPSLNLFYKKKVNEYFNILEK